MAKLSYNVIARFVVIVVIIVIVVVVQKLIIMWPITQKVLKVSKPNLEYLHIMTGCSCCLRGITLKAIVLE